MRFLAEPVPLQGYEPEGWRLYVGRAMTKAERDPTDEQDTDPVDPVLRKRRQAAQLAKVGKRYGYLLWLAAVVLFFVALATGLPGALLTTIVVCMAVGSVLLLPAIVVGYGVKAADREDRERGA